MSRCKKEEKKGKEKREKRNRQMCRTRKQQNVGQPRTDVLTEKPD